jgi:predicted NBD/HSP70 family sugar kinase
MNTGFEISRTKRLILETVRRTPGIARSALTGHAEVTQQSVHRMVDALVSQGLLQLENGVINGRGKPSPGIRLVADALFAVGVSINTDAIQLALADLSCHEVADVVVDTDPADRVRALADLRQALDALLAARHIPRQRLIGTGFSVSGFKTGRAGTFVTPVPLSDWSNRDLRAEVAEVLGVPVWLENNATAGAIGEAMVGAGLTHDTFAYLSFNYGFGGGVVSRGAALPGGFGNAGEMSAIYTPEQSSHRPALGELMKRLQARGIAVGTISDLARRYDPAWPGINEWVEEVAPQLNLLIRALRAIIDPTAIVFGGEAPRDLRQRLIAVCDTVVLDRYGSPIPAPVLVNSTMRTDPAAFGSALIPIKETMLV